MTHPHPATVATILEQLPQITTVGAFIVGLLLFGFVFDGNKRPVGLGLSAAVLAAILLLYLPASLAMIIALAYAIGGGLAIMLVRRQ